jgi:nitrate/nitrite-specific signal transduction histidine kinase
MRERAVLVGGRLRLSSPPDGGTMVQLDLPVARAQAGRATPARAVAQ